MSRHGRRRDEARERYPALAQFFGAYLHQDWPRESGTPGRAVAQAIADFPLEYRQQIRRELKNFLADNEDDSRLRAVLNDGLGVNVYFRKPAEARAFALDAEQKLLESVRTETSGRWNQ